jgi:molybdate transport system ATP-binding protein
MELGEAVEFLGIGPLLDRWPRSLSGGEARRVAIGRALLSGSRALLMDEPLTSLDQPRREEIMTVIERIRDELAIPILYVTHDRAEADRLANALVVME